MIDESVELKGFFDANGIEIAYQYRTGTPYVQVGPEHDDVYRQAIYAGEDKNDRPRSHRDVENFLQNWVNAFVEETGSFAEHYSRW